MKSIRAALIALASLNGLVTLLAVYELNTRELSAPLMTNVSRVNQLIANISQLPPDRAIEILTINLQTAQALAIASARAIDQVAWITLLFSCSNAAVLMLICLKSKTGNRKGSG